MNGRRDRWVLAALVVLPFLVFLVPLLFGRVLVPGDDLVQNYPLRALTGLDVRHGILPLWNPYAWSGTQLLGGFNAGALFPLTLLFAVLPGPLAWAVGQAVTYGLAGAGLFLFLRRLPVGTAPAGLGAVVFTWSGFMAAQLAHLGLVEGMALAPWVLLAVDHLADPPGSGRRLVWVGVLGAAGGGVCLAGDPRAISNVAAVTLLYGGWRLWRGVSWPARARFLAAAVVGAALAGLIGAAQLLPGLQAQAASQRAVSAYLDFGAGSLRPSLLTFIASPFSLGGFGALHLPTYFGDENLPELTGYVGLLPLAGALAMVAVSVRRWLRRRWLWFRRRRPGPEDDGWRGGAGVWVGVAVAGLIMALGVRTPLGHVLYQLPFYGGQRLQSRNLGVVDLALAVLFAQWLDGFLRGRAAPGRRRIPSPVPATALALVAPATVLALIVVGLAWPGGLQGWLVAPLPVFPRDWPYAVVGGALAAAVTAVLVLGPRWPAPTRARVAVGLTLVDVAFFFANAAYGWSTAAALATAPPAATDPAHTGAAALASVLPAGQRYLIDDPVLAYGGYLSYGPGLAPVPDLNGLSRLPSVGGYGSLVSAGYEAATGTHAEGSVLAPFLADPLADRLDLGLVLVETRDGAANPGPALAPPHWVPAGLVDGLPAWRNTHPLAPAALDPPSGGTVIPQGSTADDGSARFTVDASAPATLVRSEAWAPGWQATLTASAGGSGSVTESVTDARLLQAAAVPPGRWVVSFTYHPTRAYLGLWLAVSGAAGSALLVVAGAIPATSPTSGAVPPGSGPGAPDPAGRPGSGRRRRRASPRPAADRAPPG